MATGTPWTPVAALTIGQPGGREPALAVANTTPHLVWNGGGVLYHMYRQESGWSAPVQVAMGAQPALAAAPDGRLHCLFANQFIGSYEVYHTTWDGREWSLPVNVSHTGGDSTQPALAIGPDGSLHAAWSDTTPGYAIIYYGEYGEGFWSSEPVPNGRGLNPALAAAADGTLFAAWQDRPAAALPYNILCAPRQHGAWGLPESVSDSPEQSIEPSAAAGANGMCLLVWQEQQGNIYQVYYSQRVPGGWTVPSNLSAGSQDCLLPRIVAAPHGLAETAWIEGNNLQHRARLPQADAHWQPADMLAAGSGGAPGDLALAAGADGHVHLVWTTLSPSGDWQLNYAQRQPALSHQIFMPTVGAS